LDVLEWRFVIIVIQELTIDEMGPRKEIQWGKRERVKVIGTKRS
jgi:hypothetical protein